MEKTKPLFVAGLHARTLIFIRKIYCTNSFLNWNTRATDLKHIMINDDLKAL